MEKRKFVVMNKKARTGAFEYEVQQYDPENDVYDFYCDGVFSGPSEIWSKIPDDVLIKLALFELFFEASTDALHSNSTETKSTHFIYEEQILS